MTAISMEFSKTPPNFTYHPRAIEQSFKKQIAQLLIDAYDTFSRTVREKERNKVRRVLHKKAHDMFKNHVRNEDGTLPEGYWDRVIFNAGMTYREAVYMYDRVEMSLWQHFKTGAKRVIAFLKNVIKKADKTLQRLVGPIKAQQRHVAATLEQAGQPQEVTPPPETTNHQEPPERYIDNDTVLEMLEKAHDDDVTRIVNLGLDEEDDDAYIIEKLDDDVRPVRRARSDRWRRQRVNYYGTWREKHQRSFPHKGKSHGKQGRHGGSFSCH